MKRSYYVCPACARRFSLRKPIDRVRSVECCCQAGVPAAMTFCGAGREGKEAARLYAAGIRKAKR